MGRRTLWMPPVLTGNPLEIILALCPAAILDSFHDVRASLGECRALDPRGDRVTAFQPDPEVTSSRSEFCRDGFVL